MKDRIKTCGVQVNHFNHTIYVRPTWAKKARNINSDEAAIIKEIAEAYPKYNVSVKGINIKKKKECYKGLSYNTMEEYISSHDPDGSIMKEYKEKREQAKGHSIRYPNIKHWFLEKYPNYDNFEPFEEKKSA